MFSQFTSRWRCRRQGSFIIRPWQSQLTSRQLRPAPNFIFRADNLGYMWSIRVDPKTLHRLYIDFILHEYLASSSRYCTSASLCFASLHLRLRRELDSRKVALKYKPLDTSVACMQYSRMLKSILVRLKRAFDLHRTQSRYNLTTLST